VSPSIRVRNHKLCGFEDCEFDVGTDSTKIRRRSDQRQRKRRITQVPVTRSLDESDRPQPEGRLMHEQLRQFLTIATAADQGDRSSPQVQMDQQGSHHCFNVVAEHQQIERVTKSGQKKQGRPAIRHSDHKLNHHEAHDGNRAKAESLIGARSTSGG
jgi:hypothetical protein